MEPRLSFAIRPPAVEPHWTGGFLPLPYLTTGGPGCSKYLHTPLIYSGTEYLRSVLVLGAPC